MSSAQRPRHATRSPFPATYSTEESSGSTSSAMRSFGMPSSSSEATGPRRGVQGEEEEASPFSSRARQKRALPTEYQLVGSTVRAPRMRCPSPANFTVG